MYAEIIAAIQSARVAADLLKTANSLSNYNELVAAVSEVNAKLMDATAVALASQEKQSALANRIADLEKELMQLKDRQRQSERYHLHEFPLTGALAYALKKGMEQGEPMHYICATCMDKGETSKLQPVHNKRGLYCTQCKTTLTIEHDPPRPTRTIRSKGIFQDW